MGLYANQMGRQHRSVGALSCWWIAMLLLPGAAARFDNITSWAELVAACNRSEKVGLGFEAVGEATGESGTFTLSKDFEMGEYTEQIDFSEKALIIHGNNAVFDAKEKGRFFCANEKGSLELHSITMWNGQGPGKCAFQSVE